MATVTSREGPHAEEEELREVEQMDWCLFLLWAGPMSNGSNNNTDKVGDLGHLCS